MYNGVGLTSVRGTATNGYVQRNLAHSRPKVNVDYAQEAEKNYAKPSLGLLRSPCRAFHVRAKLEVRWQRAAVRGHALILAYCVQQARSRTRRS